MEWKGSELLVEDMQVGAGCAWFSVEVVCEGDGVLILGLRILFKLFPVTEAFQR